MKYEAYVTGGLESNDSRRKHDGDGEWLSATYEANSIAHAKSIATRIVTRCVLKGATALDSWAKYPRKLKANRPGYFKTYIRGWRLYELHLKPIYPSLTEDK